MNNHKLFLSHLQNQQNINAQYGLNDDVSINKKQFGVSDKIEEALKLVVRKGNKVVESMSIEKKEMDDAIAFAKAQYKGAKVTVEQNGKVVREEWEEYIGENTEIIPTSKSHLKSLVRQGRKKAMSGEPKPTDKAPEPKQKKLPKEMENEAIKYDSAGDSTGTVTGKGKRDRGPGGKVMVQYKGSETYPKGAKLPIGARDMGRLLKTARKSGTTPYDSRNLRNPRLTKDHVELEGLDLSEAKKKRITKLHGKQYPKGTHYCATHVEHAEWGEGRTITSQHAAPDQFGDIDWYDVMFEHGIEKTVPTDDLNIIIAEVHENHDHHDHDGEDLSEMNFLGKDKKFGREFYEKDGQLHVKKPGGTYVQNLGSVSVPSNKRMMKGLVKDSNESVELEEGPAHQNPRITAFGGMKAAQNTPSYKRYQDKLKAEREARAKRATQQGLEMKRQKRESVELDELKMPEKDASGRIKSAKIRAAYRKGAERASNISGKATRDMTGSPDPKKRYKGLNKGMNAVGRMMDRDKKAESVELDEVSPPGFEGTVKAMKKRHKGEIDNPWALAWYMKNKGYKSHKNKDGSNKKEN